MSTSENSETPPLTRRQLRELRNTGATPIIAPQPEAQAEAETRHGGSAPEGPVATAADAPAAEAPASEVSPAEPAAEAAPVDAEAAPRDHTADAEPAAEDSPVEEEPASDPPAKKGGVLGGLFGRKADKADDPAPVKEPATADDASNAGVEPDAEAPATLEQPPIVPASFPPSDGGDLGVSRLTRRQVREQERIRTASVPIIAPDLQPAIPAPRTEGSDVRPEGEDTGAGEPTPKASEQDEKAPSLQAIFRPSAPEEAAAAGDPTTADEPVSTVNPAFGSELLSGQTPEISLPPSFDQLISRSAAATGAVSTPNALILSQTPTGVPLVGPITSTGEVLITGTLELPEGLGSAGHAPGTTDGRDVDAVLLDGELPPASSPTPIAASAAISTVKQPGDIIRPPAPEKGSKLVVGLIITTGALAVAVAVALVLAFTTGVFG